MKFTILFLIFLSYLSCSAEPIDDMIPRLYYSGYTDGQEWSVSFHNNQYYFTDRIEIELRVPSGIKPDTEQAFWGDFRLYSLRRENQEHWLCILIPRKSGANVLEIPVIQKNKEQASITSICVIPVESMNQDKMSDPYPLIPKKNNEHIAIILFSIIVFITVTVIILKRRQKDVKDEFLTEWETTDDIKESYILLYKKMLVELKSMHPSVHGSESPSELIQKLEEPSSLNQWALRTLYESLERMETIFFQKGELLNLEQFYEQDILAWQEIVHVLKGGDNEL